MKNIKDTALQLKIKYDKIYQEWCRQNPGKIMHGDSIKAMALNKAAFAESLEDLYAMKRCFEIERLSVNGVSGFTFYIEAIEELINTINEQN